MVRLALIIGGGLLIAITLILVILTNASAGIGSSGYAQIAQRAINKAAASYGYKTTCIGIYDKPRIAGIKITCIMREP